MSAQRLNAGEKDLEKFIKFLVLKTTQVVVQSRLGAKITTQCNPLATGTDWFNLVVQDHPDISEETRRALSLAPGESILQRLPLSVEISLKTVEGDQMVLEVWTLDLHKNRDDRGGDIYGKGVANSNTTCAEQQTLKAAHAIYNRMSILLKSLVSLTRTTPAYKLSRRQCPDSYGIYYRIFTDRPQVLTLGEGYKQVRIGHLNTIVGTISMSVAYRTKMTITPTASQGRAGDNAIMVKSDHFRPSDGTPIHHVFSGGLKKGNFGANADRKVIDIEKPLRPGAFTEVGKLRQYTEDDYILPETPPFEWLVRRTRDENGGSGESLNRKCDSPNSSGDEINGGLPHLNNNHCSNKNINNNNVNTANNNNVATFKSFENDQKIEKSVNQTTLSQSPIKSLLIPTPPATRHSSAPTLPPSHLIDDDNLLKELHFPFASPTSHVNDLAKFYRDCYHAPPLHGLSDLQPELGGCGVVALAAANTSNADTTAVDDLSRQLEQFETSLEDYDKLVSQFGQLTASSSTGSRSSGGLQMSN